MVSCNSKWEKSALPITITLAELDFLIHLYCSTFLLTGLWLRDQCGTKLANPHDQREAHAQHDAAAAEHEADSTQPPSGPGSSWGRALPVLPGSKHGPCGCKTGEPSQQQWPRRSDDDQPLSARSCNRCRSRIWSRWVVLNLKQSKKQKKEMGNGRERDISAYDVRKFLFWIFGLKLILSVYFCSFITGPVILFYLIYLMLSRFFFYLSAFSSFCWFFLFIFFYAFSPSFFLLPSLALAPFPCPPFLSLWLLSLLSYCPSVIVSFLWPLSLIKKWLWDATWELFLIFHL